MWATVVLMALVAGRGPARIAAVIVILSKSRPVRLLAAYLAGGFGVSLIVGATVLFVLEGMGVGLRRGVPPYIEIGVGVFALVVAVVVGGGVVGRVRSRIRRRAAARGGAAETGAGDWKYQSSPRRREVSNGFPHSRSCRSLFRTRCWASPCGWPALLVSRSAYRACTTWRR